jgi:hypothetical protein
VKPKTLFLLLTIPLLPWVAVNVWIRRNIDDWVEGTRSLSLVTRHLLAIDNVVVRYALPVGAAAFLLTPLLAAVLPRDGSMAETLGSWPHERARATVSSLGAWLVGAFVMMGIAVPLQVFATVNIFAFSAFLAWSGFVALILALSQMYSLQEYRWRAGRSPWRLRWFVALTTVLHVIFFPVASFLWPAAFYFYSRYELARGERAAETSASN